MVLHVDDSPAATKARSRHHLRQGSNDNTVVRDGTVLRVGSTSLEQLWLAPELQHEIKKLL